MTVDARVRRGRGFATRLVGCVLLSAAVTGACELTLAGRLADQSVLREGLAAATAELTNNTFVAPYLFEVREVGGKIVPVKERESIRAAGPTVHPHTGKQAGPVNA